MSINYKNGFLVFVVMMIGLNALPVMSVYSGGSERCVLMVRGYNLVEFSSLGIVSVTALLIAAGIFFSCQSKSAKYAELLFLLVMNLLCYAESSKAARVWLESIGNTSVTYHIGVILIPLVSSILMAVTMIFLCRNCR